MPVNNYKMLRDERIRNQNTSASLLGRNVMRGATSTATPGLSGSNFAAGQNRAMPGTRQPPMQGVRGTDYRAPNMPGFTQQQNAGGAGWQQGGQTNTRSAADLSRFYQPTGSTWYNSARAGANMAPGRPPTLGTIDDGTGFNAAEPTGTTQAVQTQTSAQGQQPAQQQQAGGSGAGGSRTSTGTTSQALTSGTTTQGQAPQSDGQTVTRSDSGGANYGQWGSLQDLANTFGLDVGTLQRMAADGYRFHVENGQITLGRDTGQGLRWMDENGQGFVFNNQDPARGPVGSGVYSRYSQPSQGTPGNVQDLFARYGISNEAPQMDRVALDEANAMTARRHAQQQGRILRAQSEMGARGGASADQMAGAAGDTASQFGMASAEEQARNELQYQVQNFQAELDHYNKQFQAGMSLFSDAQSDEDRDKGFAHAMRMMALAEASQKRMIEYQNELASRITAKDVLGGILGAGTQIGGAALGGWLGGLAGGGGVPLSTQMATRSGGSILLNPY